MKCRTDRGLIKAMVVQALSFAGIAALTLNPVLTPVLAADYGAAAKSSEGHLNARFLALGVGKSIVVDLPRDVKDVLVADPKIANAVVRSAQRAYIIGAAVGQTNIIFFDSSGQQIAAYDIAVKRDLNGLRAALRQTLPNANIQVEGLGDGVMLTGSVASPIEAQQAADLAGRLVGKPESVVNSISVRGRDQVMLKVVVAEVQRDIIKQLGVDLSANMSYGTAVVNFNNTNPFTMSRGALVNGNEATGQFGRSIINGVSVPSVTATVRAMESAGVIRTLAEPSLTAISGESANFLAGGEFPVPSIPTCNNGVCTQTIIFKKFGISLGFTPVVMNEGRISLRVATEVSELSQEGAYTAVTPLGSTTIPSLKTRRADTTLEIPSGGSMVMAGLIKQQTKQAINGLPGVAQLPVLGSLFRSRDYVNNNTELMILVTPYVVRAVAQKDLSRPDDGFTSASDPQSDLLGSINRIYGSPGQALPPGRSYRGTYGFITD
jgi:pilus assembly protein CpaC